MGTRSTLQFVDGDHTIATIYQQYDGYPQGVGQQILDTLVKYPIVNGYSQDQVGKVANGLGCLVGLYIKDHKESTGNLYFVPTIDFGTQEYNYHVVFSNDYTITVTESGEQLPIFEGNLEKFALFVKDPDGYEHK